MTSSRILRYLPQGLKLDFYGGWVSPANVFYPMNYGHDEDRIVKTKINNNSYDARFPDNFTLAYYLGWYKFSYAHSYGGYRINKSKTARREFWFSYAPEYIGFKGRNSILDLALHLSQVYGVGKNFFITEKVNIMNVDRVGINDPTGYENFILPISSTTDTEKHTTLNFFELSVR